VGVAAILPHGFDEREILVGLVATAAHRPLHEHNHILQHCRLDMADVSPLHSRSKVRTYPQLAQVRGLQKVLRGKVAPKSGLTQYPPPAAGYANRPSQGQLGLQEGVTSKADELTKLDALRTSGVLTEEEFAVQEAKLLA